MNAIDSPFDDNPYAAPVAEIGPAATLPGDSRLAEAEAIRRKYIAHEASVKSVGSLYYLSAVIAFLGVVGGIMSLSNAQGQEQSTLATTQLVGNVCSTLINVGLGRGLNRLRPWARWLVGVLSVFGTVVVLGIAGFAASAAGAPALLLVVLALIPAYIAWMLLGSKGAVVFSPGYKEVMALTPHIQYKTSIIIKIFLGLLLLLIILAVVGAFMAPRMR